MRSQRGACPPAALAAQAETQLKQNPFAGQNGEDGAQRSADRKAELEKLMVKAGGLVGPDSLGGTSKENN